MTTMKEHIENGDAVLGIELGSTRIKAVLIDATMRPIASGAYEWENAMKDGIWTYSLDDAWVGLRGCFAALREDVRQNHGASLRRVRSLGISGMMHGYLVFDADGKLLTPFRTWRNNITAQAAEKLTELFQYPIPQRWSIAHLYQAILNGEEHVSQIAHATTLAGYLHWQLTGRKVMGIGEASGMFPIDIQTQDFSEACIEKFDALIADKGYPWHLRDILPEVLQAGENGGSLTKEGALLLDPTGELADGIPFCPPEGDAGTGMVATNSVEVRTGNVSAGTSVFAMLVLEKELSRLHPELDLVTTPDGKLVAMAHSNNCTSDLNAWMGIFSEAASLLGLKVETGDLFARLLPQALEGDADCGGLLTYGYISGEHVTGFEEGRPLFVRTSNCQFTLANFLRAHLFSALCALRKGLNILFDEEGVQVDEIRGHGGFFKTPVIGQRIMAAATGQPVSTLDTAGEGGAWGIALLAAYLLREDVSQSLSDFLHPVFANAMGEAFKPNSADIAGFQQFFERYEKGLPVERAAVEYLP